MASMERIAIISSLSAAIAASLQLVPAVASAGTSETAIETANELATMRSIAIAKWRLEHPNPPPRHPATTVPVTTCADDGSAGTLRSVLATVSTGDVVDLTGLSCDTITLNPALGYLMPNLAAGEFSIQGPGMQALTISGGHEIQVLGNLEDIVTDTVLVGGIEVPRALFSLGPVLLITVGFVLLLWKQLAHVAHDT